mgnify:FL=1
MESGFHMLLYRAFHAQRSCLRPWRAALGLGPGQPKLIEYLARSGPCSQRQLATYFEIDPAAVCRMLDALEKGGFVTRSAVKGDPRTGVVELTEKGRSAAAAWQHACGEMEQQLLQGFTPEEAERFAQYLRRARENLRAVQSHRQKEDVP